jgi:hypothetical protein
MSQRVSKAKWVGRLLLQISIYVVTSYVMRELLGGCYTLLIKAHAQIPPNLLLQHFLVVSIFDGLLAGLLGIFAIRVMLLLPARIQPANEPAWKRPQAWTWVISTCWLAFGICVWLPTNRSVLVSSTGLSISDTIRVFFGKGCDLSILSRPALDACMTQISYAHPWLGTIGYSAAAFIPERWTKRLHDSLYPAAELDTTSGEQRSSTGEAIS